jgi:hypothetical protein
MGSNCCKCDTDNGKNKSSGLSSASSIYLKRLLLLFSFYNKTFLCSLRNRNPRISW